MKSIILILNLLWGIIPILPTQQVQQGSFLKEKTWNPDSLPISITVNKDSEWTQFERKTEDNTYVFLVSSYSTIVHNKKAKYYDKPANYNERYAFYPLPRFTLINEEGLRNELKKCIVPYLKKEHLIMGNNFCVDFRINLQGKIEEVYFHYPTEIPLPLEVIEHIESFILQHCSVQFEVNKLVEGANFVKWSKEFQLFKLYGLDNPVLISDKKQE